MRHEARQVPSWLIFDVGQKKRPSANLRKHVFDRHTTMKWQRYLAGAIFLSLLSIAHASLELSAFASAGGDFRFLITSAESRVGSGWLSLGDNFEGHRISRFNADEGVLTLERGDESIQLRLKLDPIEQSSPRRRRVLDDGGAAERRKREIPIWIDGYGNVALGATAVTFDEIEELFRRLVEANASVVVVFVHAPPAPNENPERMRTTKNRVLGRAQEAGIKKITSRVLEVGRR